MSIEQTNDFHMVRRLARIIAPEYRLFATENLPNDHCVLDVQRKKIEVKESGDTYNTIANVLFALGHVRLQNDPAYHLLFGEGIKAWQLSEEALVDKLARQGSKADKSAAAWAASVFRSYWPNKPDYQNVFDGLVWSFAEWKAYFSSG